MNMTQQEWGMLTVFAMLAAFAGWALWAARPSASAVGRGRVRTHTRHAHGSR